MQPLRGKFAFWNIHGAGTSVSLSLSLGGTYGILFLLFLFHAAFLEIAVFYVSRNGLFLSLSLSLPSAIPEAGGRSE